jgi:hypothetical protein
MPKSRALLAAAIACATTVLVVLTSLMYLNQRWLVGFDVPPTGPQVGMSIYFCLVAGGIAGSTGRTFNRYPWRQPGDRDAGRDGAENGGQDPLTAPAVPVAGPGRPVSR